MALISAKNLISPVVNKLHLITIVLVTILFAVFRLSGGKVSIGKGSSSIPGSRYETPYTESDRNREAYQPSRGQERASPSVDNGDALSDIEKQLGMR